MAVVKRSKQLKAEYEAFLARLIQAREEAGLNQSQAAERLGKPRSFVSKCELGERRVDLVECMMFAKLYNKDMKFFCDY
jgi:transcriptional regulator with XRE-family HTH domain